MALSDLLLNKTSTPGLWFVKSRNISEDISQIIYDLAVSGALFLEIYTSDKERIVNSVISRITQDLKRNASSPNERLWIEDDLSYYYEYGTFSLWWENELNDYLPGGVFWRVKCGFMIMTHSLLRTAKERRYFLMILTR